MKRHRGNRTSAAPRIDDNFGATVDVRTIAFMDAMKCEHRAQGRGKLSQPCPKDSCRTNRRTHARCFCPNGLCYRLRLDRHGQAAARSPHRRPDQRRTGTNSVPCHSYCARDAGSNDSTPQSNDRACHQYCTRAFPVSAALRSSLALSSPVSRPRHPARAR